MPRAAPPPVGYYRCNWCGSDFPHGTGAPSRTKHGVTLKTACSPACQRKKNATYAKHRATPKCQATNAKYRGTATYQARQKRHNDARNARARTCPKAKLKVRLATAAHEIWTGKKYVKTNKCAILAQHTRFKTPARLRAVLRERAAAVGLLLGQGSVAHTSVPQFWFDYGNPDDVKRCWDALNLGVQPLSENMREKWLLDADRIAAHPPELFPAAYPKHVLLAAARHDGGLDLHSQLVLARAEEAAE